MAGCHLVGRVYASITAGAEVCRVSPAKNGGSGRAARVAYPGPGAAASVLLFQHSCFLELCLKWKNKVLDCSFSFIWGGRSVYGFVVCLFGLEYHAVRVREEGKEGSVKTQQLGLGGGGLEPMLKGQHSTEENPMDDTWREVSGGFHKLSNDLVVGFDPGWGPGGSGGGSTAFGFWNQFNAGGGPPERRDVEP